MELAAPLAWPDFVASQIPVASAWVAHPSGTPFEIGNELPSGPVVTVRSGVIPSETCSVTLTPDSSRLVAVGGANAVQLWDPAKGQEVFSLRHAKALVTCPNCGASWREVYTRRPPRGGRNSQGAKREACRLLRCRGRRRRRIPAETWSSPFLFLTSPVRRHGRGNGRRPGRR